MLKSKLIIHTKNIALSKNQLLRHAFQISDTKCNVPILYSGITTHITAIQFYNGSPRLDFTYMARTVHPCARS